jgi:hypothetical protein
MLIFFYIIIPPPFSYGLQKAITFASYKIGDNAAANGFLSEKGKEKLILHQ